MIRKLLCASVIIASLFTTLGTSAASTLPASSVQTFTSTYKGYNDSTSWMKSLSLANRCTSTQKIYGARPTAPGNYPVLLYLHGTFADWGNNKEGQEFVKRAASMGYTAMALTYDSGKSLTDEGLKRQTYCMFDQNHKADGLTAACAATGADCSKGVVVAGFSQGASIAAAAKNYNQQVKAVWAIGLSAYIYPSYKVPTEVLPAPYGTRVLTNDKLNINMGQASSLAKKNLIAQDMPSLQQLTGANCGSSLKCLQPNGSGYYVVSNPEVADRTADHAYWMRVNTWDKDSLSFTLSPTKFDPGFETTSTTDWSMKRNLNWLRAQL